MSIPQFHVVCRPGDFNQILCFKPDPIIIGALWHAHAILQRSKRPVNYRACIEVKTVQTCFEGPNSRHGCLHADPWSALKQCSRSIRWDRLSSRAPSCPSCTRVRRRQWEMCPRAEDQSPPSWLALRRLKGRYLCCSSPSWAML